MPKIIVLSIYSKSGKLVVWHCLNCSLITGLHWVSKIGYGSVENRIRIHSKHH
jgi:hypothetical protein